MEKKISKILKEIQPTEKELLRSQKIEQVKLGTIDEIESMSQSFEEAYQDASYLAYDMGDEYISKIEEYRSEIGRIDDYVVNGLVTSLEEYADDMREKLTEVEKVADELGVDPADFLRDYEELKQMTETANEAYNDARSKYTEVVEYSGFLNNFWR